MAWSQRGTLRRPRLLAARDTWATTFGCHARRPLGSSAPGTAALCTSWPALSTVETQVIWLHLYSETGLHLILVSRSRGGMHAIRPYGGGLLSCSFPFPQRCIPRSQWPLVCFIMVTPVCYPRIRSASMFWENTPATLKGWNAQAGRRCARDALLPPIPCFPRHLLRAPSEG